MIAIYGPLYDWFYQNISLMLFIIIHRAKWFILFWTQKLEFIPLPCKVFTSQNMHIIWDSSWIRCHIMSYNWIRIMWHRIFLQFTHNLKLRPFNFLIITNIQAYAGTRTKFWPSTLFSTIDAKDRNFIYSALLKLAERSVDTCTPVVRKELIRLSFWIYYCCISITLLKRKQICRTIIENLKLAINTTILDNFCIQICKYICMLLHKYHTSEKKGKQTWKTRFENWNKYHNFGQYLHSDLQIRTFRHRRQNFAKSANDFAYQKKWVHHIWLRGMCFLCQGQS